MKKVISSNTIKCPNCDELMQFTMLDDGTELYQHNQPVEGCVLAIVNYNKNNEKEVN